MNIEYCLTYIYLIYCLISSLFFLLFLLLLNVGYLIFSSTVLYFNLYYLVLDVFLQLPWYIINLIIIIKKKYIYIYI